MVILADFVLDPTGFFYLFFGKTKWNSSGNPKFTPLRNVRGGGGSIHFCDAPNDVLHSSEQSTHALTLSKQTH